MIDMTGTIIPKSDQLNADDLIGGPRTIQIRRVTASPDTPEQPIAIYFEGDNGKPYKPCKSMRRVMVQAWGRDASQYVGRSMTLYRDEKVTFGGMQVGGLRISHMSDIRGEMTFALTVTKARRAPYTVKPLAGRAPEPRRELDQRQASAGESRVVQLAKAAAEKGTDAFRAWFNSDVGKDCRASGELTPAVMGECKIIASGADELLARMAENPLPLDEPFAPNSSTITAPLPPTATDDEISARIAAELAERDRMLEGGA